MVAARPLERVAVGNAGLGACLVPYLMGSVEELVGRGPLGLFPGDTNNITRNYRPCNPQPWSILLDWP